MRISKDRLGEAAGVARQERDCRSYCEQRGWDIAEVYVENDVSASRFGRKPRPELTRCLVDARAGVIDAIVIWKTDRSTRRGIREMGEIIEAAEAGGGIVASATEGIDTGNPAGELVFGVLASIAKAESENISQRNRRKHLELAENGQVSGGGTRPFGFEQDRVTVRRDEAKLIRAAVAAVLAGGSLRGVCADWNQRGISTPTGGRWAPHPLRRLLCSPRIAGQRSHRGRIVGEAVWPAIIDERTSARLRALLLDPSRRLNGNPRSYLLTGIARCGVCGGRLVARPRADKARCYVCASGPGFGGCGKIRVLADPLEDFVVGVIHERVADPAFVRALAEPDGDDAFEEVAEVEGRLEELGRMWGAGELTSGAWRAARETLDGRLRAARARLVRSAEQARRASYGGADVAWGRLSFDQRRVFVTDVLEAVTVGSAVRGRNFFDEARVPRDGFVWRVRTGELLV